MKRTNLNFILKKACLWTVGAVFFVGCGGLKQDPFQEANESIRNAQPPSTKPEIVRPIESGAVKIQSPDVYGFRENVSGEFIIQLKTLLPGYQGKLLLKNIQTFSGAIYNEETGVFKWTPPTGTVQAGLFQQFTLEVEGLVAKEESPGSLYARKEIVLVVSKGTSAPLIKSVEITKDALVREGRILSFYVLVEDPNAQGGSPESAPKLICFHGGGTTSLAAFVRQSGANPILQADGLWKYGFEMNLTSAELTPSRTISTLVFRAISQFGTPSMETKVDVSVYTSFSNTLNTTWDNSQNFWFDEKGRVVFLVSDPKGESQLEYMRVKNDFPTGADLKCVSFPTQVSVLKCTMEWAPSKLQARAGAFGMIVRLKNRDTSDTEFAEREVRLFYNVQERPVPPVVPAMPEVPPQPENPPVSKNINVNFEMQKIASSELAGNLKSILFQKSYLSDAG